VGFLIRNNKPLKINDFLLHGSPDRAQTIGLKILIFSSLPENSSRFVQYGLHRQKALTKVEGFFLVCFADCCGENTDHRLNSSLKFQSIKLISDDRSEYRINYDFSF